jgi:hypothetical protein
MERFIDEVSIEAHPRCRSTPEPYRPQLGGVVIHPPSLDAVPIGDLGGSQERGLGPHGFRDQGSKHQREAFKRILIQRHRGSWRGIVMPPAGLSLRGAPPCMESSHTRQPVDLDVPRAS